MGRRHISTTATAALGSTSSDNPYESSSNPSQQQQQQQLQDEQNTMSYREGLYHEKNSLERIRTIGSNLRNGTTSFLKILLNKTKY